MCTLMIGMFYIVLCIKRFDIIFYLFRLRFWCVFLLSSILIILSFYSHLLTSFSWQSGGSILGFWQVIRVYVLLSRTRLSFFSPGRYSGIRAIGLMINLGSVVWLNRDGVSSTLDWVWVGIRESVFVNWYKIIFNDYFCPILFYNKIKVKVIIVWAIILIG